MMGKQHYLFRATLTAIVASAATAGAQVADTITVTSVTMVVADTQRIDPEAMAALRRMGDYLRTLNAFQVKADVTTENVGNDASARPWERASMAFDNSRQAADGGASGVVIGSALAGAQTWGIPSGFDRDGFLSQAKANFVTLQNAWDKADIAALRAMMTDEMVGEIRQQLADRETHTGGGSNQTDVVMLNAQLLGIEDLGAAYMASVEFSGMIREEPSAGPSPFREVWNMTKPKDGSSGWLVAGLQALQ